MPHGPTQEFRKRNYGDLSQQLLKRHFSTTFGDNQLEHILQNPTPLTDKDRLPEFRTRL